MQRSKSKPPDLNDILRYEGTDAVRAVHDRAVIPGTSASPTHRVGGNGKTAPHPIIQPKLREPSAEEAAAEVERLARLSALEYDRQRKAAASQLLCSLKSLDRAVKDARAELSRSAGHGRPLALTEPTPWDNPVHGHELLEAICDAVGDYVILSKQEADAIALWVLHAHVFDAFTVTPRLGITSAQKRCGKTTLLDVLHCLVPRPLLASNISAAATFRTIEFARPTLLIDEADTFLRDNEDLRGILNSGHRERGSVVRLVGDNHEPRQFSTYAPVAIALIGALPGTLADRSIPIRLQRRRADENVIVFRADRTARLAQLASMAARWTNDNRDHLLKADPDTPGLFNRDADNWRPLLAIADTAGGDWPERARIVAKILSAIASADQESLGTMALADIRVVFAERTTDRLTSKELVDYLHSLEDRPWIEFGRSRKAITSNGLARLLKPFNIRPVNMRSNGGNPLKGYFLGTFQDAFERYLEPADSIPSVTQLQVPENQRVTPHPEPSRGARCSGCD